MKKKQEIENNEPKKKSKKNLLLWSFTSVTTFAVAAAGAFFLLPQQVVHNTLKSDTSNGGSEETPSERFVNRLISSATSGLELEVTNLDFSIPGAVKSSIAQSDGSVANTYYENHIRSIEGNNATIKFAMDSLSISGINLSAELPLEYNGLKRELNLGLLGDGETEKNLYFDVADIDGNDSDWSAGYQVSVLRETDTTIVDPTTGGNPSYEYGRLDFVIHDIIEILTKGGINISTYGKIGDLLSSSSGSTSSIDTDAILDALGNMEETKSSDGSTYFVCALPLGDTTLSLGFASDTSYNLTHIDMPAVASGETQGTQKLFSDKDWTIQLSADVKTKSAGNTFDWTVPDAWKAYPKLEDSLELYRKIAQYVASPKFGVSLEVEMEHKEEATKGTYTTFGKSAVDEKAKLTLDGDVDLSWNLNNGAITGANFNAASADLAFSRLNSDGSVASTQSLSALIDNGTTDTSGVYLNMANTLKARTTKTTLDEIVGKFTSEDTATVANASEVSEEKKQNANLDSILDTMESVLKVLQGEKDFQTPALIASLREKHYEAIVEMLEEVKIADNLIMISISMDNLGFKGASVVIELNGEDSNSLASIKLSGLKLSSLSLDLTLKTTSYEDPSVTEEMLSWGEITHLPTVIDQFKDISEDKKIALSVDGSIEKEGTKDVYNDEGKAQGMDISGKVALDFSEGKGSVASSDEVANPMKAKGSVSLKLVEKGASYYQDHNIALDLVNSGESLKDEANQVYFHYDSLNSDEDLANASENRTNPTSTSGINGKLGIASTSEAISSIVSTISGGDSRFDRISRILSSSSEASLLSDMMNRKYFSLADYSIIKSSAIGETKDEFVLDGSCLGLGNDVTIALNYADDKKLSNFEVSTSTGEGSSKTNVDVKLGIEEVRGEETFSTLGSDKSNYDDYSGLASMLDYGVETSMIGIKEGEGVSTYDLKGDVALQLGDYETTLASAELQASVEGARVKMLGSVKDMPVIRGINAPDDEKYFRPLELGGKRTSSFYYYSDGIEDNDGNLTSELLMTRTSDYGKLANVSDSVKLNKAGEFKDDALSYILQYFLGIDESLFSKEENSTTASKASSSKAIHIDDIYKGFAKTVSSDGKAVDYTFTVSLNSLLGVSILDDITLSVKGGEFINEDDDSTIHALNEINVSAGASIQSDEGNRMNLVKANVSLYLDNLKNGYYSNGWSSAETSYSTNFLSFNGDEYTANGIYAEATDAEGGKAWRHGVDSENKGHRNYYLGLSK